MDNHVIGVAAGGSAPAGDLALGGDIAGFDQLTAGSLGAGELGALSADGMAFGPAAPAVPGAPSAPSTDTPDVDDVPDDFEFEPPSVCTVVLPSPAPAVAPSKEVAGAQSTAEAATGQQVPADAAPYVEDAVTAAGCPDTSGVPSVPVPGLPV